MEKRYCMGVNNGQRKNKQCVGVSCDELRTSIAWVYTMVNKKIIGLMKRRGYVGRVGVLKLYKFKNFGWSQFPLAVPTTDNSIVSANSLRWLSCSVKTSTSKNENIRLYFYVYVSIVVCQDPPVVYHIICPFRLIRLENIWTPLSLQRWVE